MTDIIVKSSTSNLIEEDVRLNPVALASANPFVPMFAYFTGSLIKKGDKRDVVYSPIARYPLTDRRERDTIFRSLFKNAKSGKFSSGYVYDTRYFVHKHALYEVDNDHNVNVIFMLAVRYDHFLENIKYGAKLDNSKLMMFVNNEINLEKHSSVQRRFKRYYDDNLQGIDLVYTNDINSWCFNNNLKNIKFKDIIQRIKFINEIKSKSYGKRGINEQQEPEQQSAPTGEGYIYSEESANWWSRGTTATYTFTSGATTTLTGS